MIATSTASVFALSALSLSFTINAVYIAIAFLPVVITFWALLFMIRPIMRLIKPTSWH